ncbi:MAG: hypothetical protein JW795_15045 [Chitinivibrionales bacterium]|nr:hypothetical protein [Chitinivibrionales bacterium]
MVTDTPAWRTRAYHTCVVFRDSMWILGGKDDDCINDIWSSGDGVSWNKVTDSAAWQRRQNHTSLVYKERMWVLGGTTDHETKGDVWYSSNGRQWSRATDSAGWKRFGHASVVYDDKMWVIGGFDHSGSCNDAWYSTDGVSWTKALGTAGWIERSFSTTVVLDNKIVMVGGRDDDAKNHNDVWAATFSTGIAPTIPRHTCAPAMVNMRSVIPNPFRHGFVLTYDTREASDVSINLYNQTGKLIFTKRIGSHPAGAHTFVWDDRDMQGRNVESGMYHLCVVGANARACRMVVRMK